MTHQAAELLDRARKFERQGRPEEAAAAFAAVADTMEAGGDWASAVAVRGRHARALQAAGRTDEALRVLARADQAAGGLRGNAEVRAVLDGQAAHVLAGAGRAGEAARRAWGAMTGFRSLQDHKRADRAAVHAARLIVKDAGARDAQAPLRDLLAQLPPSGDGYQQVAAVLAEAERRPDRDHDILVADPEAATWGRLAAALAVGAHLAVGNGVAWNTVTGTDRDPSDNRTLLERDWGITDSASWREAMDRLLAADNCDPAIQIVLDRRAPGMTDPLAWHSAIAAWCQEKQISIDTTEELVSLSRLILRYEDRFRIDGLLPADGRVDSVIGYDFGRAVNMARWGLNAGYCDGEAAEDGVLRAGHYATQVYDSWEGFSAGYILGRMLRFDDAEFGEWYQRSLTGHRILVEDPGSPWRKLAWG
ncbi:DUF1266 domain-containing protein [Spirillospora sp. NPDC047279]|uniref:DUF1266 domain-containing protein n=1 Tax=Spirillospora sp. NPDC047279 TaxID=3155478 RepID=UPI0033FD6AC1